MWNWRKKLNCLLRKSNLHVTNEISFLNASMIFNPTLLVQKKDKCVDGVRQCCVELLSTNVTTTQVEPVIRSVLMMVLKLVSIMVSTIQD